MRKSLKIAGHLFFWLLVPFLTSFVVWAYQFTAFLPNAENQIKEYSAVFADNVVLSLITVVIGASGFYLMYLLIIPEALQRGNKIRILLYSLVVILMPLLFIYLLSLTFFAIHLFLAYFVFTSYLILIPFSFLGALLQLSAHWRAKERENSRLEKQNLQTRLALLQTQISPHFLFNTINNIDVLIENNPKMASTYLRELSDILRFMLYKTTPDRILLQDEICFIKKYVELQKIRSVNPDFVKFSIAGEAGSLAIAPLIFIVFVENAFKYVAGKKSDNAIELNFSLSPSQILFRCKNTVNKNLLITDEDSGIGISSVKQRLDLLYKKKHDLKIISDENHFSVSLQIMLA